MGRNDRTGRWAKTKARTISSGLCVTALGVMSLAAASPASATTTFSIQGSFAIASFYSEAGCLDTYIGIFVQVQTEHGAGEPNGWGSTARMYGETYDECAGKEVRAFGAIGHPTPNEVHIEAVTASLHTTMTYL